MYSVYIKFHHLLKKMVEIGRIVSKNRVQEICGEKNKKQYENGKTLTILCGLQQ